MKQLNVVTTVGTRPEIIRLSRVIARLDASPAINHVLVHTGQNYDYELNEIFFEDLGIRKPDHFLNAAGEGPMDTIGMILAKMDQLLDELKPDAFLVLGDTNSCLAALAAKRKKIPVFHMEAGNRCFDQRVPEEINRKIVDHLADINLPYSSIAREYLLAEGFPADRIIKTGSPMFEVLNFYREKIDASSALTDLDLERHKFFVVSAHREENVNDPMNFNSLVDTLNSIAEGYGIPVVVSMHPRTRKVVEGRNTVFHSGIRLLKPLSFSDYNCLQLNAKAVLSDSGTISEESSILGFPALNLREAHERPEAMEEAVVMMVGLRKDEVLRALTSIASRGVGNRHVTDYSIPDVSIKVERIILSYTAYVNRVVWGKGLET